MCFDVDARPPIAPILGGALDAGPTTLRAEDGTELLAYRARAAKPTGAGMLILPDVRGLHPYFEELAQRFAEHGVDAVAIDYFARTADTSKRGEGFDHAPHVAQTTWEGLSADIRAGVAALRSPDAADGRGAASIFSIGFCMGGRLSFLAATLGLDMAGVVGFYGWPTGPHRSGSPAPAGVATAITCPVLEIWGGADQGIRPPIIAEFDAALDRANVVHRSITYPDAPHSFFDRGATEHAAASAAAWEETLAFVRANTR
jgi:carboxymethylenebutenolidase